MTTTQAYDNEENLKKAAPTLFSIPRKSPFKVPANYFEQLEIAISVNVQDEDYSILNISNEQHYSTPPNYFDQLPLTIQEKIVASTTKRERPLILRPAFAMMAAAAFLIILFITKPSLWKSATDTNDSIGITIDDLSSSTYLSELDESILIEEIEKLEPAVASTQEPNSEVEDYLIDNNFDITDLTFQL